MLILWGHSVYESMERRLSRESKGSLSLQKKMVETVRRRTEPVPDLTDFMNDMFFGTADVGKKNYDLTGRGRGGEAIDGDEDEDDYGFDDSTRSNSARLTQEWLEEARRIVAVSSPARTESPGRLVGSPRFAAKEARSSFASFDRRDPLSRSARRNKALEGFSEEILSKSSSKHSRNKSDTYFPPAPLSPSSSPSHGQCSPASPLHLCLSNDTDNHPSPLPRPRKSRFQTQQPPSPAPNPHPHPIQPPSRRSFSPSTPLSPPKYPVQSVHRRSQSSSTCSLENILSLSNGNGTIDSSLNGFLKQQRILLQRILNGEPLDAKPKIVLSSPSNSTASMVAAICHAWLLSYRERERNDDGRGCLVAVPVMNVSRDRMWKLRQAAWLFHHAGLDATALLFSDEVDMESLMMKGQLSLLVVGQDILRATSEVGSQCTILTDNYCEDAYDLLQNPVLKKLLLAGILLDTQNLKASAPITMARDTEAVQLLLVGSAPNYRHALFDQLMQDQKASSFLEALSHNYGKPPDDVEQNGEGNMVHKVIERKSTSTSDHEAIISSPKQNGAKTNRASPKTAKLISPPVSSPSPTPANAEKEAHRGKNKFFLAKWFGFGSK